MILACFFDALDNISALECFCVSKDRGCQPLGGGECSFLSTVSSHGTQDRARLLQKPPTLNILITKEADCENGKLLHNPRPCEELSKVEGDLKVGQKMAWMRMVRVLSENRT